MTRILLKILDLTIYLDLEKRITFSIVPGVIIVTAVPPIAVDVGDLQVVLGLLGLVKAVLGAVCCIFAQDSCIVGRFENLNKVIRSNFTLVTDDIP